MKLIFKNIGIVILALLLVFVDVCFFGFLPLGGISILSSFLVLVTFALLFDQEKFLIFALSLVIWLSIFSSLPTWVILAVYVLIPSTIVFLRKNYLPEPSIFIALFYFFVSTLLTGLFFMIDSMEWNDSSLALILFFSLINTIAGFIIFVVFKSYRQRSMSSSIKL